MINGILFPNRCKKCEVIDRSTGRVLLTEQGCGSANTQLEEKAKVQAFDLGQGSGNCNLQVICSSYRADEQ